LFHVEQANLEIHEKNNEYFFLTARPRPIPQPKTFKKGFCKTIAFDSRGKRIMPAKKKTKKTKKAVRKTSKKTVKRRKTKKKEAKRKPAKKKRSLLAIEWEDEEGWEEDEDFGDELDFEDE
jgi:hypothetical protein